MNLKKSKYWISEMGFGKDHFPKTIIYLPNIKTLPILPNTPAIMKASHSNVRLSKKSIITQVIKEMSAEIDFTEKEIDQLYKLSIECRNNSLSQEELITKISNLRGGSFIDIVAALGIIGAIIILSTND